MLAPGQGFEHGQMSRSRFVQSGQQAIDSPHAAFRGDDDSRPALPWQGDSIFSGHRFQRPHDRGPDRDHAFPGPVSLVDDLRRRRRYPVVFLVWRFMILETGHASVQDQGTICTPLATRRVINSGVKARPAEGISALPFSVA